jgi:hypothetical protein
MFAQTFGTEVHVVDAALDGRLLSAAKIADFSPAFAAGLGP